MLKTIRQIWIDNLTRLIGNKTKKAVAAESGIAPSTLFNMLNGHIAEGVNLTKLCDYFGVSEAELFVDHSAFVSREALAIQDGLAELFEKFPKLDHAGRELVLKALRTQFDKIHPKPDSQIKATK